MAYYFRMSISRVSILKIFFIRLSQAFAKIFYSNCFSNGILPIRLSEEDVDQLFQLANVAKRSGSGQYELSVDLNECTLSDKQGFQRTFEVEPFRKRCLLEGLDNISLALQHTDEISAWEKSQGLPPIASS